MGHKATGSLGSQGGAPERAQENRKAPQEHPGGRKERLNVF